MDVKFRQTVAEDGQEWTVVDHEETEATLAHLDAQVSADDTAHKSSNSSSMIADAEDAPHTAAAVDAGVEAVSARRERMHLALGTAVIVISTTLLYVFGFPFISALRATAPAAEPSQALLSPAALPPAYGSSIQMVRPACQAPALARALCARARAHRGRSPHRPPARGRLSSAGRPRSRRGFAQPHGPALLRRHAPPPRGPRRRRSRARRAPQPRPRAARRKVRRAARARVRKGRQADGHKRARRPCSAHGACALRAQAELARHSARVSSLGVQRAQPVRPASRPSSTCSRSVVRRGSSAATLTSIDMIIRASRA